MNFKTTDALFNKIKEDLYSFDAAGLLDENRFYKDVQYVLASLGIMWYRDGEEMISIDKYNGCLPKDFNTLEAIYKCSRTSNSVKLPDGIVFHQLTFDHYPETQIPDWHVPQACPPVDFWSQDPSLIFNRHELLLVQRGNEVCEYHPPTLMRPGNVSTHRSCSKTCPNLYAKSQDTFTIQNSKVYTNFEHGEVLILYKAFPLDENGLPMIPDNVLIEKAIEDYIKYNVIKNLRTNGDASVAQLITLYQSDMDKSMGKAITETKTPGFSTMIHNIRLVRKRLNVYQFPNMGGH